MWNKQKKAASRPKTGGVPSQKGISSPGILAQRSFERLLHLERKRAERTHRPFVLMLLQPGRLLTADTTTGVFSKLLSTLSGATRDTDITGWYEDDSVIGVLFTEIGAAGGRSAANILLAKITDALSRALSAEQISDIAITFHVFPEAFATDSTHIAADTATSGAARLSPNSKRVLAASGRL